MNSRKIIQKLSVLLAGVLVALSALSQNSGKDEIGQESALKSGFSWGGTPILAFDADLGLRYGAAINLFDYGKESVYPNYRQYAFIKVFHTSKGTTNLSFILDSEKILPRAKVLAEVTYMNDIALDFYGFNGMNARVDFPFEDVGHPGFGNRHFYSHSRRLFRLRADVQKYLHSEKFRLYFGLSWNNYAIHETDFEKFPDSGERPISLYQEYIDWNLIPEKEKNGGQIGYLAAGFIYDSRDNTIYCTNGMWLESYLVYSPEWAGSSSFSKHIFTFRQYFHWSGKTVFSYRMSSQQKLSGNIPFYFLPTYFDSRQNQDGLGGAFNLRGISRNRIAADGFLLANLELRRTVAAFRIFRLNTHIDVSLFTDAAYVTQKYKVESEKLPAEIQQRFFNNSTQKVQYTFGPGLYFVYNTNNIISVNYGYSPEKQLGNGGFYVGSAFLF
jgi:hypothetical protein